MEFLGGNSRFSMASGGSRATGRCGVQGTGATSVSGTVDLLRQVEQLKEADKEKKICEKKLKISANCFG